MKNKSGPFRKLIWFRGIEELASHLTGYRIKVDDRYFTCITPSLKDNLLLELHFRALLTGNRIAINVALQEITILGQKFRGIRVLMNINLEELR